MFFKSTHYHCNTFFLTFLSHLLDFCTIFIFWVTYFWGYFIHISSMFAIHPISKLFFFSCWITNPWKELILFLYSFGIFLTDFSFCMLRVHYVSWNTNTMMLPLWFVSLMFTVFIMCTIHVLKTVPFCLFFWTHFNTLLSIYSF